MRNWYLKRKNEITGPFSQQELREWFSSGKLTETDLAREGEEGNFIPACETPGLLRDLVSATHQHARIGFMPPSKKRFSLLKVLGFLVGLPCLIFLVLIGFDLIHVEQTRGEARRSQSKYNLKQISSALLLYHDQHNTLPPGAIIAADETPLHNWQALILPFIDQRGLHQQIDFEQPWNHPVNQQAFQQEVPQYLAAWIEQKHSPEGYALSHYVGNEFLLKKNQSVPFREITDGTSNTITAIERGTHFQPWGAPENLARPIDIIGPGKKTLFPDGNHVLFSDGRVRFLSKDIDPAILKALSTPAGGEKVGEF